MLYPEIRPPFFTKIITESPQPETFFSLMGSRQPHLDTNPIFDEGAPRSVGGVLSATHLSNILGTPFEISPRKHNYDHSWGPHPSSSHPIFGTWTLKTSEVHGSPTYFSFDIIHDHSPLIIGLDTRTFSNTYNLTCKTFVIISRPSDTKPRKLYTYTALDHYDSESIRIQIVPHHLSSVSSLISTRTSPTRANPITIAKRIHRYSHTWYEDMKTLLKTANRLTPELDHSLKSVANACEICSGHRRPSFTRKVSISRINSQFNEEIQIDFVWISVRDQQFVCLHIIDTFSSFSEPQIAPNCSQNFTIASIKNIWIYKHGEPQKLSGDQEFDKSGVHALCNRNSITFCPRPTRRHNKSGIV